MSQHPATESKPAALAQIVEELRAREPEGRNLTYHVPAAWTPVGAPRETDGPRAVNPYSFMLEHIGAIEKADDARPPACDGPAGRKPGDWVRDAVVYNVFVRLTSAYDHDRDGQIGTPDAPDVDARTRNQQGVRETGTFLKTIALLGHMRSLGATAIHLLPITSVGRFGNKGNLGSPYAIRNPYALEETLADPLIRADVDTQFRALVEACHALGMRVICEFVFRTASRDADSIAKHPDWFYWIKREVDDRPAGAAPDDPRFYGSPPFESDLLAVIKDKVARHDRSEMPPPPQWYRDNFQPAPRPDQIRKDEDGRWVGTLDDGSLVHVPSAFADWPPDDFQPPWTDVTYLRLYGDPPEGPSFNYIAYNTIRMYDERLARQELANPALWAAVRGILPHWQRVYGIDGCMVDMGHALPPALMASMFDEARANHPDFALLSENFVVDEHSASTGYNSVLGYQFRAMENADQIRQLVARVCVDGLPVAVFGAGETHNTPRVAMRDRGARFCRALWMLNCFLPDTIPFIHGGFELADPRPVNLGLAFTPDEVATLGQRPLALFDLAALQWDEGGGLADEMARISTLRDEHAAVVKAQGETSLDWLPGQEQDLLAFRRHDAASGDQVIMVVDWRCNGPREVTIDTRQPGSRWIDPLDGTAFEAPDGHVSLTLQAGEGRLLLPA